MYNVFACLGIAILVWDFFTNFYQFKSIENIISKIELLKSFGYTEDQIIKMTKNLPSIYSLNNDNIKRKFNDLMEVGYSGEEVLKMTISYPSLYSLGILPE